MNFLVLAAGQNGRQHDLMKVKQSQLQPISQHVARRILELGIDGFVEELKASELAADEARLCEALDRVSTTMEELTATLNRLELPTAAKRRKK
jgi:hypothetical protein